VRFDDRLRTVLVLPASDPHDRAVRWRQLVELIARAGGEADPDLIQQATAIVRQDLASVPERVRSAAALAAAPLTLPAELVAVFAADRMSVAAPVLASARLTASELKHVSAAASDESRALIASMRSDEPEAPAAPPPKPPLEQDEPDDGVAPSISELVARIERLRSRGEARAEPPEDKAEAITAEPAEPEPAESPRLFQWECNEAGEIDWVGGAPRGALVGHSIANGGVEGAVDRSVERAFAARAPFREGRLQLTGDGRLGGVWKISGVPAFERTSGRFAGYRGVAERPATQANGKASSLASDPGSLRELAHEIRTPLTAIVGFAEIISGDYFGPAESRFRERAADIVGQAKLLLAAIDDLDFAARVHSARSGDSPSTNLGEVVERVVPAIRESANARGITLDASRALHDLAIETEAELAERLILRLCNAVVDRARPGERLRLTVDNGGHKCSVVLTRPAALQGASEEALFGPANGAAGESFWLRLTRGMARIAEVELEPTPGAISLNFPCA
jgi:hypothetical protein